MTRTDIVPGFHIPVSSPPSVTFRPSPTDFARHTTRRETKHTQLGIGVLECEINMARKL